MNIMAIPKTVPETFVFEGFLVLEPDNEDLKQALWDANHSPNQAFRCLEFTCAFNKAFQPLPSGLHDRLFMAVEKAGKARDPVTRNRIFLQELGLLPKKRPAKMSFMVVGEWLSSRPVGETRTQSINLAAKKFKISPTTVRSYWARYDEARMLGVQYSADGNWSD